MKTFVVTFRVVHPSWPGMTLTFRFTVTMETSHGALGVAYNEMTDMIHSLFGKFDQDWVKRRTVINK